MSRDKNSFIAAEGLDGERRLFVSRIDDMVKLSEKTYSAKFSGFLTESEYALAEKYLKYIMAENFLFFGGYEGAQRVMLGVFGQYDEPDEKAFPISVVMFSGRMAGTLTHREYLGSIMSLGIERDLTGDIVTGESCAYAMLCTQAAELAVMSIDKIGRNGIKCSYAPEGTIIERYDTFSEISATIASVRLDAVISAALRISREKSAQLIRAGAVSVNHGVTESVSETLSEGDVLSVRGHGRYILSSVGDRTKKDRIRITVKKYL